MNLLIIVAIIALAWIGALFYLRRVWFYRDPKRIPEKKEKVIISPADGQIVYVEKIQDNKIISEKNGQKIPLTEITKDNIELETGTILGIYMSPLDVHFNYAPLSCRVAKVVHTQAKANLPMIDLWEYVRLVYLRKFVNLFSKKFHFINERNTLLLEGDLKIAVVEIADKFVNKIKSFVKEGQDLEIGQKIGFIERGSQVDLIIPDGEVELKVKPGQQVYGGKTIIATYWDGPIKLDRRYY